MLTVNRVCVRVCVTEIETDEECVYACILYVPCNLTPINLIDDLVIITKCRFGKLKLGLLRVPVISQVIGFMG